ncbi:MAG: hypothetical protein P4L26_14925 [Terracidiphilus sp.]|nr:hypothetical protein [Terracidiphilus sp.]
MGFRRSQQHARAAILVVLLCKQGREFLHSTDEGAIAHGGDAQGALCKWKDHSHE